MESSGDQMFIGFEKVCAIAHGSQILQLLGKLPDHPNHPKGRNPYAHVALKVKDRFGCSYKDITDEKYQEVVDFLYLIQTEEG